MSILYKSKRVGLNGDPFTMFKFRTLKDGTDKTSSFAQEDQYTRFGKFLRKTKLDEFPQLWNVLKGDMAIFGPRPEEERTIDLLPDDISEKLLSVKPGIVDPSSLYFYDEESILQLGDPHEIYWQRVRPMKLVLQMFYIENRSLLLNLALVWLVFKRMVKSLII